MKVLYIVDSTGASSGGGSKVSVVDTLDVLKRHYGLKVRVWWRRGVSIMIMVYRFRSWVYSYDNGHVLFDNGLGLWCRGLGGLPVLNPPTTRTELARGE